MLAEACPWSSPRMKTQKHVFVGSVTRPTCRRMADLTSNSDARSLQMSSAPIVSPLPPFVRTKATWIACMPCIFSRDCTGATVAQYEVWSTECSFAHARMQNM